MTSTSAANSCPESETNNDEACGSSSIRRKQKKTTIPIVRRSLRLKQTEKKMEVRKTGAKSKSTKQEVDVDSTDEDEDDFSHTIWDDWLVERHRRGGDCTRQDGEELAAFMARMLVTDGLEEEEKPSVWEKATVEVVVLMNTMNNIEEERLGLHKRLAKAEVAHLKTVQKENALEKQLLNCNKKILKGMKRDAARHRQFAALLKQKEASTVRLIAALQRHTAMLELLKPQKDLETARHGRVYFTEVAENRRLKGQLATIRRSLERLASDGHTPHLDRLLEMAQEDFDPEPEIRERMEAIIEMISRNRIRNQPASKIL